MSDAPTDLQLNELIRWHAMDGTKRGQLTTTALMELQTWRESFPGYAGKTLEETWPLPSPPGA